MIMMGDTKRGNWIKARCLRQSQISSRVSLGEFLEPLFTEERLILLGTDPEKFSTVPVIVGEESFEVISIQKPRKVWQTSPGTLGSHEEKFFSRMECDKFLDNLALKARAVRQQPKQKMDYSNIEVHLKKLYISNVVDQGQLFNLHWFLT